MQNTKQLIARKEVILGKLLARPLEVLAPEELEELVRISERLNEWKRSNETVRVERGEGTTV